MIQGNDDKWLVVKLLSVEGKFVKAHEFGQQDEERVVKRRITVSRRPIVMGTTTMRSSGQLLPVI